MQKFFMEVKGRSDAVQIGILYINPTLGNGSICSTALARFPKNGKTSAKAIRQNRQEKNCDYRANLAKSKLNLHIDNWKMLWYNWKKKEQRKRLLPTESFRNDR